MAKQPLTKEQLIARTLFRLRVSRGGLRNTDDIVNAVKFTVSELLKEGKACQSNAPGSSTQPADST
jgi:hypothetical protein